MDLETMVINNKMEVAHITLYEDETFRKFNISEFFSYDETLENSY
jgi:hypothetical protein